MLKVRELDWIMVEEQANYLTVVVGMRLYLSPALVRWLYQSVDAIGLAIFHLQQLLLFVTVYCNDCRLIYPSSVDDRFVSQVVTMNAF